MDDRYRNTIGDRRVSRIHRDTADMQPGETSLTLQMEVKGKGSKNEDWTRQCCEQIETTAQLRRLHQSKHKSN